ncbi:MAG TPA: NADH-quinone oxidoreductase subunit J [Thermoanaerobaculia bacterium]|jgi:NADH-quinone oxidoreductase subunit J|nr:NADH-quinone oxidoreductase subunit J [Thermoanaerobaculia bacterium]
METAVFVLFAFLAVAASVVVVAHRNPVYSTMGLVLTLFAVAVLFVLLGAPFLAALQILIYAGAIVVLFLFVLMLLNITREEEAPQSGQPLQRWAAILGAAIFCGMLGMLLWRSYSAASQAPLTEQLVSLKGLAGELFTEYLLPFEIVGLLLLVAVIAATVIARRPGVEGEP